MTLSFLASRWAPLETERLRMRMLGVGDVDVYAEMMADPEIMRFMGDGTTASRDQAWRSIAAMIGHWTLRGYGFWAVDEKATGEMVGRVGFWNPDGWPGFELGWMLRKKFWGRGYATEAARAALSYGFTNLPEPEVISLIRPDNTPSIRVAERIGETLDRTIDFMGKPALVYKITRDQWEHAL